VEENSGALSQFMKRKVTWQVKIILILAILVLVGFIQWESWFPLEIQNESLQRLADGGLACGALFLLVCFGFGKLIQLAKGFMQGILFLLFPFLILLTAFIWFASNIMPIPKWKDMGAYKNGGDYLVIQRMNYPTFIVRDDWRIIRTASSGSVVRWIEAIYPADKNKEEYTKGASELKFAGKIWHKVQDD
jgi:hypothetical protein